ncbi:MAG TPA: DUF4124 domain-containing protein [Steroidobacteraceae bacterium]|nr:DUF4124 domain-containing protein [Steroidobacteraceae bacterium]
MSPQSPYRGVLALVAAAAFATAATAAPQPGQSGKKGAIAYRWVDDQGVVHYGDEVPPQAASKDREVLNSQGVRVRHLDAEKTSAEAAAEAHARAALIKQRQHDSFLVTTYTSVKDIESLRDARLEQLKAQRAAAQQYVDSLRSRLDTLQTRALAFRPYSERPDAHRLPDDLAEDLVRTLGEVRAETSALAANSAAEAQLRADFQADIERYRELHTVHQ